MHLWPWMKAKVILTGIKLKSSCYPSSYQIWSRPVWKCPNTSQHQHFFSYVTKEGFSPLNTNGTTRKESNLLLTNKSQQQSKFQLNWLQTVLQELFLSCTIKYHLNHLRTLAQKLSLSCNTMTLNQVQGHSDYSQNVQFNSIFHHSMFELNHFIIAHINAWYKFKKSF